jgi:NADH-quinone oxidoreductase subunit G
LRGRHGRRPPLQSLRLGTYRSIWASPEVEISPSLHYTVAHQQAELSPQDARRLGIATGETVEISQNGTRLTGTAAVRSGVPEGTVFLATGIAHGSANALTEPTITVAKADPGRKTEPERPFFGQHPPDGAAEPGKTPNEGRTKP